MASWKAWVAEAVDPSIGPDDAAAIQRCVLDYFEGWFEGDAARMDRALHPGLAKHALEYALLARTSDGWRITGTLWHWAAGHGPSAA